MEDKNELKKRGNFLFRQELKNLTLEPTPICAFSCNLIVAIIFLSVMNPLFKSANDFKNYRVEYTDCNDDLTKSCIKQLKVEEDIEGPILVFYEVEDFYINHKEFVRSKKYAQLRNDVTDNQYFQCEGAQYMYQVKEDGNYTTYEGYPLQNTSLAYPCGLFAKYEFNDTFKLFDSKSNLIEINEKNISYKEQRDNLFKNNEDAKHLQWKDIENEHFIVWMTAEANHNFIKLWGKIDVETFPAGDYTVNIDNRKLNFIIINNLDWTAGKNLTKKYFKISNVVPLGSDSLFAVLLLIFGVISLIFSILMGIIYFTKRNDAFDPNKMNWEYKSIENNSQQQQ